MTSVIRAFKESGMFVSGYFPAKDVKMNNKKKKKDTKKYQNSTIKPLIN